MAPRRPGALQWCALQAQRCLADSGKGQAVQEDTGGVEGGGEKDEEEEEGSALGVVGVGVGGAARCARHSADSFHGGKQAAVPVVNKAPLLAINF